MSEKLALSVTEAAELMGLSRPTVYKLLRRSDFPVLHVGTRTLIPRTQLLAWIEAQTKGGKSL